MVQNEYMRFCASTRASRAWAQRRYHTLPVPDQGRLLGLLFRHRHHHARYRSSAAPACARERTVHVYDSATAPDVPEDVANALNTFKHTACKSQWFVPISFRHGDLEITDDLTIFALRDREGTILGTIAFNQPDKSAPDELEIELVCTIPSCGYGADIMARFFRWVRGEQPRDAASALPAPPKGIERITLTSVPDALGFYKRVGFRVSTEDRGAGLQLVYTLHKRGKRKNGRGKRADQGGETKEDRRG